MTRHPSRPSPLVAFALPLLLVTAGCAEPPTGTAADAPLSFAKGGGKPNSCSAFAPLVITLGNASGDGLTSDGLGVYQEGVDGVQAHINDPTGNLSIWTTASTTRSLKAHTTSGTVNIDRAYTNSHNNDCGLKLATLPTSSTAVFEGEVRSGGTGSTIARVRYGLTCSGTAQSASRVAIVYGAGVITLTAPDGNYCTPGSKKNTWVSSLVSGFSMTMAVAVP